MRLLGAELRRLTHRRAVRWLFLVLVLLCVGFSVLMWSITRPQSAADIARQEDAYQAAVTDWQENGASYIQGCLDQQAAQRESDPTFDGGCTEEKMAPQRSNFSPPTPSLSDLLVGSSGDSGAVTGVAPFIAGLLALLMGAMFVGGEFASGSISTWLTFEPRRTRVSVTKLAAVAVGAVVFAVVGVGILTLGSWLALRINHADTSLPADLWLHTYAPRVGWAVLVVVAGGLAGAGLTFALRHTGAVIGLVAGYGVVAEAILPSFLPAVTPYLISYNILAFVSGETSYTLPHCATDADGLYQCQWIDHTLTRPHAAIELGAILLVCLVAGWAVFRRSEVK